MKIKSKDSHLEVINLRHMPSIHPFIFYYKYVSLQISDFCHIIKDTFAKIIIIDHYYKMQISDHLRYSWMLYITYIRVCVKFKSLSSISLARQKTFSSASRPSARSWRRFPVSEKDRRREKSHANKEKIAAVRREARVGMGVTQGELVPVARCFLLNTLSRPTLERSRLHLR